jgi:prefoldin subunit 5
VSQLKVLPTISVVALTAFLLLSPFAASAAGATVTVKTDQANYSGVQSLTVFGTVSPAPSASGSNIVINIKNQLTHATVISSEAAVGTDGTYTTGFVTGGSPNWTQGTYVVNATYLSGSVSGSATVTFAYSTSTVGGGGLSQAEINYINSTLKSLGDEVSSMQSALTAVQNAQTSQGSQISSISSSLTSLSGTVAAIQTSLSGLTGTVNTINTNMGSVQTTLNGLSGPLQQAGQTQTYVLVVAVLTAITLVLVLAVLVRRLS